MQALEGLKVLELGQLIAGPFAAKTLGDFGADVIKVETAVTGDPLRKWRMLRDGTSVWWQVQSRNKRSVCIDLRGPEGQAAVRALAKEADVLIENFKPGTLEGWGLGWEELHALNPRLIMLRISGYGQTGPYRDKPGFGVLGEAMGGLRHLTGEPGRVPVRVGVSIGDTLAALHGVIGVLMALHHRNAHGGEGQMIDMSLFEAVFNVMESLVPEYDAFGAVRAAAGSALPGIAPTNAYPCSDGSYVLVAGNGDSIFRRLMRAIGRIDLENDPLLAHNDGRVKRTEELDAAIGEWTQRRSRDDVLAALDAADVPAGRIYSVADIVTDPQYLAREMIVDSPTSDGQPLKVPGIVPKLSATPGQIAHAAPRLGPAHRGPAARRLAGARGLFGVSTAIEHNDFARPRVLADIGGTNARFAWQDRPGAPLTDLRKLRCAEYPSLEAALREYLRLGSHRVPVDAAMAMANPVVGDRVRMTNHSWEFSIAAMRTSLGLDRLLILNDFTALALSLPALGPNDLRQVGPGAAQPGTACGVIGPGTGLGVSGLLPDGRGGWVPVQGEGGHVTLAPRTPREQAVVAHLDAAYGHASAERAVSGPGLVDVYRALGEIDSDPAAKSMPDLRAEQVTHAALDAHEPRAIEALNMMCAFLGTVAGNLALTLGALGGIYIAGGIVPRLGAVFDASPFRERFESKGRFRAYVSRIPTLVIVSQVSPALLGAERALDAGDAVAPRTGNTPPPQ